MIYRIRDLIGDESCKSSRNGASWSRAIPLPFYGGYLSATWAVLTGRAVAVKYPESGELEQALHETGGIHIPASRTKREDCYCYQCDGDGFAGIHNCPRCGGSGKEPISVSRPDDEPTAHKPTPQALQEEPES